MKLTRSILFDVLLLVSVVLFGSLGYVLIEHWSFFDGLYMTVITLTTIGFGEIHTLSTAGRIFTMLLIVIGIGTITYTLGTLSAYLFGQKVYNFVNRRRMAEKIDSLHDHYIICGASEVGLAVVEEMILEKTPVILIDRDSEKLNKVVERNGCLVICGDATQEEILMQANIKNAKGLVASFGNDHENVYLIMTARQMSKRLKIYAKVKEEETSKKLLLAGADEVINPYQIGGLRLASSILRPHVVKLMDEFAKDPQKLRIEELTVDKDSDLFDKSLSIEAVEQKLQIRVIAIKKAADDSYHYLFTHKPFHFEAGDALFFIQAKKKSS